MRILILSDIHSNWPALQAIDEPFDHCLFVGDLVDYATDPLPCIEWIRQHATATVRGNHDHAVAQHIAPSPGQGLRRLAAATRPVHWERLSSNHLKFLARFPVSRHLQLAETRFYLVHATPRDPFDEYVDADKALWNDRLAAIDADVVCVGHSHLPFHIDLGHTQVINPGSVGQPRDGDPRASYVILEDGVFHFRRVEYDIDATLNQMRTAGVDDDALAIAESVLRTGGRLPDQITESD